MEQDVVVVPGGRDVRGTLDRPIGEAEAAVVACPPHPKFGGNRRDRRLRALGQALGDLGLATLRFDYGPWDGGEGERADVRAAIDWARERYDPVGLFGYSFGAANGLLVAADRDDLGAVSVLAPDAEAADAVDRIDCPLQVAYGVRDDTVDWEPVVERARRRAEAGHDVEVVEYAADHHFVGQEAKVADGAATFLADRLAGGPSDR